MRISDWSSDVCSSDLSVDDKPEAIEEAGPWNGTIVLGATARTGNTDNTGTTAEVTIAYLGGSWTQIGRASCRERVCQDVSISVVAVSLKKKIAHNINKTHREETIDPIT